MANDGLASGRQLLAAHRDQVLPGWIDTAAALLRGRMTRQELDAELADIYTALSSDAADDDHSRVRALVAELSRSRARQGFSPMETAVTITSIKDPVIPLVRSGVITVDDFVAVAALGGCRTADRLGALKSRGAIAWIPHRGREDQVSAVGGIGSLDTR